MDYIYQQKSIRRYSILEGVFFFIEQHIKEKISLGQITEGSMISQGYLSRIFRDQFGISTMEYILTLPLCLALTRAVIFRKYFRK